MSLGLDGYTFRARWTPCVLVAAPLVIAVAGWFPSLSVSAGLGIPLLAAAAAALSQLARLRGRDLQTVLWNRWGGPPTTLVLRHGSDRITTQNLLRYRRFISEIAPDVTFPSPEEESANPEGFEDACEVATHMLINRTRNKTVFGQLYAENVWYGFWRNLLAIRSFGLASGYLAFVVAGARLGLLAGSRVPLLESPFVDPFIRALFAVMVAAISVWWFTSVLREDLVRRAAFNYAERLIEASEQLSTAKDLK